MLNAGQSFLFFLLEQGKYIIFGLAVLIFIAAIVVAMLIFTSTKCCGANEESNERKFKPPLQTTEQIMEKQIEDLNVSQRGGW